MAASTSESPTAPAIHEPAPSVGPSVQPTHDDAPLSRTDEALVRQAALWAALVRSFVTGKNTRALNHAELLQSLHDASGAGLSAHVLVKSRLYAAVKALGQQIAAEHMFKAIGVARKLAGWWEVKFGVEVLQGRA